MHPLQYHFCHCLCTNPRIGCLAWVLRLPRVVALVQRKKPGPPHRARNALLYLQLRQEDIDPTEVRNMLEMAGLDSMP